MRLALYIAVIAVLASLLTVTPQVRSQGPVISGWQVSPSYASLLTLDKNRFHSGTASVCARIPESGSGLQGMAMRQSIKADAYRGRKVQVSAYMWAQGLAGFVTLHLLVDGKEGTINNCWLHPVEFTRGWEKEPWSDNKGGWGQCDVPNEAVGLTVYLEFSTASSRDSFFCMDDVNLDSIGPAGTEQRNQNSFQRSEKERQRVKQWYSNAPQHLVNASFDQ